MPPLFHRLFAADSLPPNSTKAVEIEGRDILVCHAKDEFFAVQNLCTHQAAKLEGGRIRSCFISCPLHGVMFDLRNGVPKGQLTDKPLATFETRIVEGFVEVALSPAVES